MNENFGSAQTVATKVTRFTLKPSDMGKSRNKYVIGYMLMEGEVLDIHQITLDKGKITFNASCIASHPHTGGELVGMVITDPASQVVWEDEEHVTPAPSGINVGDTLEMDFQLDPMGGGRTERWVLVK